jgi:hypothetical protein
MTAKLNNTRIGTVSPLVQPTPPFAGDARTAGLQALAEYISELTFYKAGEPGKPPVPFQIPIDNIYVEQPDNEEDLCMPSIAFMPAGGEANMDWLGHYDETSVDEFGKDTVLYVKGEHIEFINLHIYTQFRADRRAIIGGLQSALVPVEEIWGFTLVCPNYYRQTVSIAPMGVTIQDGDGSANNRREAMFRIDMRINVVALTNYRNIMPLIRTELGDGPVTK